MGLSALIRDNKHKSSKNILLINFFYVSSCNGRFPKEMLTCVLKALN